MEGTIAEVRLFASNFAPKNWAYCQGQIIAISSNTALFSLLGTTYGGNGSSTFALPNLSDSVAVGAGSGPGLTPRQIGEVGGANSVTLMAPEMPAHTHSLQTTPSISVNNTVADTATATNGVSLANSVLSNATPLNSYIAATPDIALSAASATVSIALNQGALMGGNQPHSNQQPSLGLAFIICQYGVFPQRPQ